MDADRSSGLVDLPAQPLCIPAGSRSISRRNSHFSFLSDRRRRRRSRGAPESSARIPICSDDDGWDSYDSGRRWLCACLAYSLFIVYFWFRAGVWRSGLPGIDSDLGRERGYAKCDRVELDPVQCCGHGRPGARRAGAGETGGEMVFRPERRFVSCADRFTVDNQNALPARENHGVDVKQPEAGHTVRPPTKFHGSANRACFLHDRVEYAHAYVHPRIRKGHFPSRSGDLRQSPFADGPGLNFWLPDHRQRGQHAEERIRRLGGAALSGRWDFCLRSFEVGSVQQCDAGPCGRCHDGSVRHSQFPRTVNHYQRNAWTCDERLQLRLPRWHAHGKSFVRVAGAVVLSSGGPRRERTITRHAGSLLLVRAAPIGRSLKPHQGQNIPSLWILASRASNTFSPATV